MNPDMNPRDHANNLIGQALGHLPVELADHFSTSTTCWSFAEVEPGVVELSADGVVIGTVAGSLPQMSTAAARHLVDAARVEGDRVREAWADPEWCALLDVDVDVAEDLLAQRAALVELQPRTWAVTAGLLAVDACQRGDHLVAEVWAAWARAEAGRIADGGR
jgi:hypothetical protein